MKGVRHCYMTSICLTLKIHVQNWMLLLDHCICYQNDFIIEAAKIVALY